MPFKSQAQRRWMYATKPAMAKRWEAHTPAKRLPARVDDAAVKGLKRAAEKKP